MGGGGLSAARGVSAPVGCLVLGECLLRGRGLVPGVSGPRGVGVSALGEGVCSRGDECLVQGGCLVETPRTATAAGGTHPTGIYYCLCMVSGNDECADENATFFIGIIADVQYADVDDGHNYSRTKGRYYRNSVNLLTEAIKCWNNMSAKPSFMFQLGDLIDGHNRRQEGMSRLAWDKITGVLSSFDGNVYHTCGNHEYYNFTHKQIAKLLPAMTLSGSKDPDTDGRNQSSEDKIQF